MNEPVDYSKIEPFKQMMKEMGKKTLHFPNRRLVWVESLEHGAALEYQGEESHLFVGVEEGLGDKNWIAEWMYKYGDPERSYYDGIAVDTALMAVNDLVAHGAMPVMFLDHVAAGTSEWFEDSVRARDFAKGMYKICEKVGMALPAGESPALRYLVKSKPPIKDAPVLAGCATGIVVPTSRLVRGDTIQEGDVILGVISSGLHANGVSLVIKTGLALPEKFLTRLPTGRTLGEEALIPTRSYVAFVEALQDAGIHTHAFLPGTGSGLSKIAFHKKPFTYRIHTWVDVPPLFQFIRENGVSLRDCLTTFNWGIGYYAFVSKKEVARAVSVGEKAGYGVVEVGRVEKGERKVIFEPEKINLPPPGEK